MRLESKDLMIGNYVECDGAICEVVALLEHGFSVKVIRPAIGMHTNGGRKVPIPITPEILLQCGFKHDYWEKETLVRYFVDSEIRLRYNGYNTMSLGYSKIYDTECQCSSSFWIDCDNLHKLQNLIFALTGTPLTVTL